MAPIPPALTKEEWAAQRVNRSYDAPYVGIHNERVRIATAHGTVEVSSFGPERHSLAALALHGQPFGFDRRDVHAIESALFDLPEGGSTWFKMDMGQMERLHSLAGRIAALLPPEDA